MRRWVGEVGLSSCQTDYAIVSLGEARKMSSVEAIYCNGVFRPLGEVPFAENQRVRLTIELTDTEAVAPIRTAQDLLDSDLVGIWRDREDIASGEAFARELRQRAESRESGHADR
jgi:predicted DNA-binding antitoxin AbrB/MazE fold protein